MSIQNQFDYLQSRGQKFFNNMKNGSPGINPLGEWQNNFENLNDVFWGDGVGKVVNFPNVLKATVLGGEIGAGVFAYRTDPQMATVMRNMAAPVGIGLGIGAGYAGYQYSKAMGAIRADPLAAGVHPYALHDVGFTNKHIRKLAAKKAAMDGFLRPLMKFMGSTGRGAANLAGNNAAGVLGGAARLGGGAIGGALHMAAGLEYAARGVLTAQPLGFLRGKGLMANNALDAYLPNFRNLPAGNIMKYAPNPSIIRRASVLGIAKGFGSMFHEMVSPAAPPPTAVFDGRFIHHRNDMGANAQYGQSILGRNSVMNDPQAMGRIVSAVF